MIPQIRCSRLLAPVSIAASSVASLACGGADESLARGPSDASFQVRESVEQLHVTHATPGATLVVERADRSEVAEGEVDELGSLVFRELNPGNGYFVVTKGQKPEEAEGPLTVMSFEGSLPDPDFYAGQQLQPGFGYIETRDGTTLSIYVQLPGPPEDGPYPTLVNYSGYSPSKPGAPLDVGFDVSSLCGDFSVLCDAPDHPSGVIGGVMGYATVGVNIRGTGCSGGAFDYFEPLQSLDGYDVIETVAAQDWVLHNRVGMAGLSYPGISQLYVAGAHPPSLAAIAPMSVIADIAASTLAPGGIFNDGFALSWAQNVGDQAAPYGRGWEQGVVDGGDEVCEENQLLHGQRVDTVELALENEYYPPEVADERNPYLFVGDIDVPVLLSGAWQDEQTGPHFAALLNRFVNAESRRFIVFNGVHPDGYTPQVLGDWKSFFDIYVARRVPEITDQVRGLAPLFFQQQFGAAIELPPNRFEGMATLEEAQAAWEAEDELRVIFESGASADYEPGVPQGTFDLTFERWPVPGTRARRWFFGPGGALLDAEPPSGGGASSFTHDPAAATEVVLASGSVWDPLPDYDYQPLKPAKAIAFVGDALAEDTVMIGHGSVDLWLSSTAEDADLEVNLTEVRADGQEMYVQSGWLRASHRALSDESTELRPVHTHLAEGNGPLVPGEWTEVRVELMPFAHVFRAGSRIRISVDSPGSSRAEWKFIPAEELDASSEHSVGHSAARPSSVVLPVIEGASVQSAVPPCPSLRGQPCRAYVALENTPAEP